MKVVKIIILSLAISPTLMALSLCPDKDDITHGLNTQQQEFHRGSEIYLAGRHWLVEETQTFKRSASCQRNNFFDELHCNAKNKKLRFLQIPLPTNLCKYQVYIVGSTGVFGEFSLRPLRAVAK